MIESKYDIFPLLNEYISTQHEWMYQFWMGDAEKWNDTRQAIYISMVLSSENSEKAIFLLFKPLN